MSEWAKPCPQLNQYPLRIDVMSWEHGINTLGLRQNDWGFTDHNFKCIFLNKNCCTFDSNFIEICFQGSSQEWGSIVSDNHLAPIRQQAVFSINDGIGCRCMCVSLRLNELWYGVLQFLIIIGNLMTNHCRWKPCVLKQDSITNYDRMSHFHRHNAVYICVLDELLTITLIPTEITPNLWQKMSDVKYKLQFPFCWLKSVVMLPFMKGWYLSVLSADVLVLATNMILTQCVKFYWFDPHYKWHINVSVIIVSSIEAMNCHMVNTKSLQWPTKAFCCLVTWL